MKRQLKKSLHNAPNFAQLVELEFELRQPVFLKTTQNCRQMSNPSVPTPPPPKGRIYSLMGSPLFKIWFVLDLVGSPLFLHPETALNLEQPVLCTNNIPGQHSSTFFLYAKLTLPSPITTRQKQKGYMPVCQLSPFYN